MIIAWQNRAAGTLQVGRVSVHLTPLEGRLIDRLIQARGAEVTTDQLVFAAYNGEGEPEAACDTLKVVVCKLRKKGLPIEPRNSGHRCGYWLEGIDWFVRGQRFKVPTGTIRVERVVMVPSLVYYHENLGVSEIVPLSDPRIEKWEAS